MRGFQRWMKEHPRKRTDGFFSFGGKELTHEQVKKIVNYAVEKGYQTDADIPTNEVERLLEEKKDNKQEPLALF
jgi:hypothetical protein